ncbi:MAG: hypothetical protein RIB58_00780 [Phycisphaerales bacterium]|jgi:hypothetical protein
MDHRKDQQRPSNPPRHLEAMDELEGLAGCLRGEIALWIVLPLLGFVLMLLLFRMF